MFGIDRVLDRLDSFQRRHRWSAFGTAVVRKFGDDQAGYLASLLAYYAFFSLFPMLLLLVTGLGLVMRDTAVQERILHSTLVEFPIIGEQLQRNVHSLNRTGIGFTAGLIGTILGARGLAATVQYVFNTVWGVPHARRPGFPWSLLRSLGLLVVIGAAVLATGFLSGIGGGLGALGLGLRVAAIALSAVINAALFTAGFRLAIARQVPLRCFLPSAVSSALAWQALLAVGGLIIEHSLRHAGEVYGLFGLVLGLLAWLHLQAQLTLYVIEADVVRAKGLWPRGLFPPPLTEGDERAYTEYAQTERRLAEQQVRVDFPAEDEG
jgi:YihY family inner membrane protein